MKRIIFPALLSLIALAGCSSFPQVSAWLTPYRMDVHQGNFVTQEMVAQLKLGQSRDQVRFILGTALLTDPFHSDRWDYLYRFQPGHGEAQQRRLTVYFADDKLARLDGDVLSKPPVASAPLPTPRVVEIGPAASTSGKNPAESGKAAPASN